MSEKKQWFQYTDEGSRSWRLKVAPTLAGIGGLVPCEESSLAPIPDTVEPRYMWIIESTFEVAGKEFGMLSYYGETMYADE